MTYPTMEQVEQADHEQICRWWRFLRGPGVWAIGEPDFRDVLDAEAKILNRIAARLDAFGGFTPEISKRIGLG
jgi:hypothetical protein